MFFESFEVWNIGKSETSIRHKFLAEGHKKTHSLGLLPYQQIYALIRRMSVEFGTRFFIFKNDSFAKGFDRNKPN